MVQKVKNNLQITCEDVDFTTATDIEFYIRQGTTFKEYTPTVVSEHLMTVLIPKTDAMALTSNFVELQFALTDADSQPQVSRIVMIGVATLLKEAGYGA